MLCVITYRMSTEELEQLKQELEARFRQLMEDNPDCGWLKTALNPDDPGAAADEPEADDIDELLPDLDPQR